MLRVSFVRCLIGSFLLTACGGPLGADDIADQDPQGLMEGEEWVAVEAGVRRDTPGADGLLTVSLFATDLDECSGSQDVSTSQVLFTVPAEVGEYPLRFDFSDLENARVVNFSPRGGENIIASEGVIVIEAISETEVTLGVLAMTGSNEINGRITAPICP